jgi:release factor glutamine methyltransferase
MTDTALASALRESAISVGELLAAARGDMQRAGADSPGLTALILLEHATGLSRPEALARPERLLTADQLTSFRDLVARRRAREPLAYILGYREFYGRRFVVSPATLIPRPETEALVEAALVRIERLSDPNPLLLDVGTGSGAIAVSVLAERTHVRAIGTDTSSAALGIAAENARSHGVTDRLCLVACDLVSAVRTTSSVVLANLPYVPEAELDRLEPEVSQYEPRTALDGGPDGMAVISHLLPSLDDVLAPGGTALVEFGEGQAQPLVRGASSLLPSYRFDVLRDRAGTERILVLERPAG